MPVIKSAKKKLRQDKKRQVQNQVVKDLLKKVVKTFRAQPNAKNLQAVYQTADKAVKNHLIHPNKAARIKSTLAKTLAPKGEKTAPLKSEKTTKKTPTKKSSKTPKK